MKYLIVNQHSEKLDEFESVDDAIVKLVGMSTDGCSIKVISEKLGVYSLVNSKGWVLAKIGPESIFEDRLIK